MFKNLNQSIKDILKQAEKETSLLNHPYVGSEHLLLAILKEKNKISTILEEQQVTYQVFRQELVKIVGKGSKKALSILYTPLLKRIIDNAIKDALEQKEELSTKHLLLALIEEGEGIAIRLLIGMDVPLDKLYYALQTTKLKNILSDYGTNLNNKVNMEEQLIGREKELEAIIEVLLQKNKNNPLLLGEAGVGKTAIVEQLARLIKKGNVPGFLKDKTIISLEMSSLVAGTKYRGEFEERLMKIINEAINNQNIILFIDEIHTIAYAGGAEGAIDAGNILKPYLARGEIKVIGATTLKEYEKHISKDRALERRFQNIIINEPSLIETKNILLKIKKNYERHYQIKICAKIINDILMYSQKFLPNKFNPDKSIEVLDAVCAKAAIKRRSIHKDDIIKVMTTKANLPEIETGKLNYLESVLNKEYVNNENNNKQVIDCLKQFNRLRNKPYSVLITGFNHDIGQIVCHTLIDNYLTINMSEYYSTMAINKLLGSPPGYAGYDEPAILDMVKFNPRLLINIINYSYGHEKVKDLIEQIIKDGVITNNKKEQLDFTNCFIIVSGDKENIDSIGFIPHQQVNHPLANTVTKVINYQDTRPKLNI